MAAAPTLTWEQYQQLPPDQRRRPLTDAEYAALTKQQRIAAGLDEDQEGAPANFNGPVFPNPDHIQPRADTDPAIDPTRLPEGVTFQHGNWSGTPQMDISNPAAADVQPEMGREVGAKFGPQMSTQPATPPQTLPANFQQWDQAPDTLPANFSGWDHAKAQPAAQDASSIDEQDRATTEAWAQNHPVLGPITRFLVAGGQNAGHAITDTPGQLYHAIIDPPTVQEAGMTPEQRVAYRLALKQAIEAGTDYASGKVTPKGAASVLPEALGTGVGQVAGGAVYGKPGEIAGEVLPEVPAAVQAAGDTGARAVRAATRGANKVLAKAPGTVGGAAGAAVGGYLGGHVGAEVGGAAGAMVGRELLPQVKIPGEGFGFPNRVTGGPEVAPQYEAPAEGEAAPEEPAQPQAAAPIETKAPPAETPAPQVTPQGTPAETPGPAADDLLERLKGVASRIQKQEAAGPGSADEDLVQQAQDSLDMVRARKAVGGPQPKTSAESLDEFNQRLSAIADRKAATAAGQAPGGASSGANSLNGIFNRLVKGEAGQAGLPGSVTNADEGIAEIQNRPVIAQRTQQVSARGYLRAVGADENSVLKTPRDQDSVFWHRQQIAQSGQPPDVELHVDEGNNVIGAQGRHRAIAAVQQGGPKAMVNVTVFKHPDPAPR